VTPLARVPRRSASTLALIGAIPDEIPPALLVLAEIGERTT
jgi:hypothetical protein